jgi:hypothetical protein
MNSSEVEKLIAESENQSIDTVRLWHINEQLIKAAHYFFDPAPVTEDGLRELGFFHDHESYYVCDETEGSPWMKYDRDLNWFFFDDTDGETFCVPINTIGQLRRLVSSLTTQGE